MEGDSNKHAQQPLPPSNTRQLVYDGSSSSASKSHSNSSSPQFHTSLQQKSQITKSSDVSSLSSISHSISEEGNTSIANGGSGRITVSSSSVGSRTGRSTSTGHFDKPELVPESSLYSIPSPSNLLSSRPPGSSVTTPPSIMPVTYGRSSPLSLTNSSRNPGQRRPVANPPHSGSSTSSSVAPPAGLIHQGSINSVVSGLTADSGRSNHSQGSNSQGYPGVYVNQNRISSPANGKPPTSRNSSSSNPGSPIVKDASLSMSMDDHPHAILSTKASMAGSFMHQDSITPPSGRCGGEDSTSGGVETTASMIPTTLDQFAEYDFHTVRQRLTWSCELTDDNLRKEYHAFYREKTSLGLLFYSSFVIGVPLLGSSILILANTIKTVADDGDKVDHLYQGKLFLSIIGFVDCIVGTAIGVYLDYCYRHQLYQLWHDWWYRDNIAHGFHSDDNKQLPDDSQATKYEKRQTSTLKEVSFADVYGTDDDHKSNQPLSAEASISKQHHVDKHHEMMSEVDHTFNRRLRHIYVLTFILFFLIAMIHRILLTPDCHDVELSANEDNQRWVIQHLVGPTFLGAEICSEFPVKAGAIMGNSYIIAFVLFIFVTHFPDLNMKLIWFCLALMTIIPTACAIAIQVYDSIAFIPTITIACILAFSDIQIRHIVIFLTTRKLKIMIIEKERVAAQTHANEMRHMIANVAHDLKTPLSSFTTGVDLIQLSFSEIYHSIGSGENAIFNAFALKESLHSIQSCINNIRNTNSFMLMTINRCIDYTKATKGMKLVPRYETVDLRETLQLPLSCMINIQNRIEIKLKEIDMSKICSHIITDKQWLQENVLCLLSNAVKYSSEGTVTISVFLDTESEFVQESSSDVSKVHDHKDVVMDDSNTIPDKEPSNSSFEPGLIPDEINRPISINIANSDFVASPRVVNISRAPSSTTPSVVSSVSHDTLDHFNLQSAGDRKGTKFHKEWELPRHHKLFLRVDVEDTGIGMSDEAMASLFNAFKQTQRLAGGTGLGLYSLAKRLEAMNGRYGVMRRRDGLQGSLFWFAIPYRPDEASALLASKEALNAAKLEMYVSRSHSVESLMMSKMKIENKPPPILILSSSSSASTSSSPGNGGAGPSLVPTASSGTPVPQSSKLTKTLKILLVDDSPAIIKMTGMMLKRMGHQLYTAENGAMAVKAAIDYYNSSNTTFDVILMDLQMPVMDGLEATRRIREFERRQCPNGVHHLVVGMSANSDADTMDEAFASDIDLFMPKPFNMTTFNEKVLSQCVNASTSSGLPPLPPPPPSSHIGTPILTHVAPPRIDRKAAVETLAASTETDGDHVDITTRENLSVLPSLSTPSSDALAPM